MKHRILFFVFLLCCCACNNFPKDPSGTLEQASGGTLLVGYSENPPWVVETDSVPAGIEPALVKAFAATLGAKVEWRKDSQQNLFEDLEMHKIHLVVAGITNDTPWKKRVALTRPYLKQGKQKHVMAAMQGENAFIVRLEKFLYKREQQLADQLTHEGTE